MVPGKDANRRVRLNPQRVCPIVFAKQSAAWERKWGTGRFENPGHRRPAAPTKAPTKAPTQQQLRALLKMAAPFRQYGPNYNRSIDAAARDLEDSIRRKRPTTTWAHVLKLRLDATRRPVSNPEHTRRLRNRLLR